MTDTERLVAFLLTCIGEVEATATAATEDTNGWGESPEAWTSFTDHLWKRLDADEIVEHIARHAPTRVLSDCAARRALIAAVDADLDPFDAMGAESGYEWLVLQHLAQPFRDHPGFNPAWLLDEPDPRNPS